MPLLVKAYQHRDRLSDAERYIVLGTYYYRGPEQDIAKSASAYETLLEIQPDNYTALNNVAIAYRWMRNWAKAEDVLRRSIATGYGPAVTYNQLTWVLWNQGKREEAWRHLAAYDSVFPSSMQRRGRRFELYFSARHFDSASALLNDGLINDSREPLNRSFILDGLSRVERTRGRLAEGARRSRESMQIAVQNGRPQARLENAVALAMDAAILMENRPQAVAQLNDALRATPLESLPAAVRPYSFIALAYGLAGEPSRAEAVLASFENANRGLVKYDDEVDRNLMRGAIAFGAGRYEEATRHFRASSEVGDCMTCDLPMLGMSYDRAGMADSALAVYRRYTETSDVLRYIPDPHMLAVTHRRMGELYEAKGDVANAHANYAAFVDLWRNADPELQPKVGEVRRRMARLRDTEPRRR